MADPKKYFQFNVTPKLGVTPNQIHQSVRRKQIIQTLTDISDKKVKSAKQKAKTSAISKINYSSYGPAYAGTGLSESENKKYNNNDDKRFNQLTQKKLNVNDPDVIKASKKLDISPEELVNIYNNNNNYFVSSSLTNSYMPNNMFEYHLAGFKRGLRDMLGGTTSNYQQYGEKTALDATELGLNKNYKPSHLANLGYYGAYWTPVVLSTLTGGNNSIAGITTNGVKQITSSIGKSALKKIIPYSKSWLTEGMKKTVGTPTNYWKTFQNASPLEKVGYITHSKKLVDLGINELPRRVQQGLQYTNWLGKNFVVRPVQSALANPLSTIGYMTSAGITDAGLTDIGINSGILKTDENGNVINDESTITDNLYNGLKFITSTAAGGVGDLAGNTLAQGTSKLLTNFGFNQNKHKILGLLEDKLLNSYGTNVFNTNKANVFLNNLKSNSRIAGTNSAIAGTIGTLIEPISNISDNPYWQFFTNYTLPYVASKGLTSGGVRFAELASNGADNPAAGASNVMKTIQSNFISPVLKYKINKLRQSDGGVVINEYLQSNKKDQIALQRMFPKLFTPENIQILNLYANTASENKMFTANYASYQKRGTPNAFGGGNSRGLSARNEFENLNGYTTNQFYNPKSDIAKTHIGYSIENRNLELSNKLNSNELLSAIAGSAGSKGKGKSQIWTYTQDKEINDKFTKEAKDLFIVYQDKSGIHEEPLIKNGKINSEAINKARFGQRQDDPFIGLKTNRGIDIRENWDGHTKFFVFRRNNEGNPEVAYTIGTDVAGGATMDTHGNTGGLASYLDAFHHHNVTTIKIEEGIPHNNIFGNSTVALSSKQDYNELLPKLGKFDFITPKVNSLITKTNNDNIANRFMYGRQNVINNEKDLQLRTNLANFYNSYLGYDAFKIPSSSHGITLNQTSRQKAKKALENAQKVLSKKSKIELSRSSKSSNKSTKTRTAKSKTDSSTLDIWLQQLPLETRQKLIQYQKQGGKFEQRQRVLDRLNSKQQFKNGGTLTQFLLKEGKL